MAVSAYCEEPSDSLGVQLQEIVVEAKQPVASMKGNTVEFSIAGSNLQNLGTSLDVLAQLTMIRVDDNVVTVDGKGEPEIYIDGSPMRDNEELRNLSSSDMKKVELVVAPGAMYESDTEAVIRITTRRRLWRGVSLTDRAVVERRRKWSASDMLDINWQLGKWELFATGNVARYDNMIKGTTVNTLDYEGQRIEIGSSQSKNYPTSVGTVKAGFNFASDNLSVGAYYRYNPERGDFSNYGEEWIGNEPRIRGDIGRVISSGSHLASVYFDNLFGGNVRLHFDGIFRYGDSTTATSMTYPGGEYEPVRSNDRNISRLYAAKLWSSFPLFKGDFTAGVQDSYTRTSLDFSMLNPEIGSYIPSGLSESRQTSLAAFASWSRTFGRFSISAGLRYEYTDYTFDLDGKRDEDVSRRGWMLTPDVSLGYSFSDDAAINLSYRSSTVKPPYSQLTGSLSYVGRHEIEGGNPALRDERMHRAQLFGMWRGFMLQTVFSRSLDTYAFVKQRHDAPTLQLIMHPVNVDVSSLSAYLIWSRPVGRWTPDFTLGVYRQWLEIGGRSCNRPIFSYSLDNVVSLPWGILISANAYGQTKGDMHTNRMGATWFSLDASVSKSFFNRMLTVKLAAADIFNTRNNDWTLDACGVRVVKRQSYDGRGVSLTLTLNLRPRKSEYKGETASQAEIDRL